MGEVPIHPPSPPSTDDEYQAARYVSTNGAVGTGSESFRRLLVLAYILAFSMPPLGLLLGIVVATRPDKRSSRHWPWIVALSLVAAAAWFAVLTSGALRTASTDF